MNCKPGDLAYVRAPLSGSDCPAVGKLVTVLRFIPPGMHLQHPDGTTTLAGAGAPVWEILFASPVALSCPRGTVLSKYWTMFDHRLRPIRDPGDDAVDESKAWLPPVPLPAIDPSLIPEKEAQCS